MSLSLKELLDWVAEIADLAKATHDMAENHANSAQFYRDLARASTWQGQAAQEALMSMLTTARAHGGKADDLGKAAAVMDRAHQNAEALANTIRRILADAAESPAVEVDLSTNQVSPPPGYEHLDGPTKTKISEKIAALEARIADALDEGDRIDEALAQAIATATGVPPPSKTPKSLEELLLPPSAGPLAPGQVRNRGPVAGTGAVPGLPHLGAADLGEVVPLPDGTQVAIFGDSWTGGKVGEGQHYPSVAVPVAFDAKGQPHYGLPLTGPEGSPNVLFPMPAEARAAGANNTLPAGTIRMNGETYMLVAGTSVVDGRLVPTGGSWLVKVGDDFTHGWQEIPGSWRKWEPTIPTGAPTQISGFQSSRDGMVYIAGDSFDCGQGVTMYRFDPSQGNIFDRSTWQPWTGHGWGVNGQAPAIVSGQQSFGELSFQEVDGKAVLSGFNSSPGVNQVEIRVADDPTTMFGAATPLTVVAHNDAGNTPTSVWQPYGGYILPGSTLENMNILVSQWNTGLDQNGVPFGKPYDSQEIQVHPYR